MIPCRHPVFHFYQWVYGFLCTVRYLQSWCSCGHPTANSLLSGPCGQCCGCDNTPLLTGFARTSSWPPAHWDAHALPGSLQPQREKQKEVMCHVRTIWRLRFTLTYITLLYRPFKAYKVSLYGEKNLSWFFIPACWWMCLKDKLLLMRCSVGANSSLQLCSITICFVKWFSARRTMKCFLCACVQLRE